MPIEDLQATRRVQHEIARRPIDTSRMDVRVLRGVVYLHGEVRKLRDHPEVSLKEEMEILHRCLRIRDGIREVVDDTRLAD